MYRLEGERLFSIQSPRLLLCLFDWMHPESNMRHLLIVRARTMRLLAFIALLTIYGFVSPTFAGTLHGTVTEVINGDSFMLTNDRGSVLIALKDIDCPEIEQPYGLEARKTTMDLVLNKTITVNLSGDRNLAVVVLPDKRILNEELIRNGSCWVYSSGGNPQALRELEAEARRSSAGLWAQSSPQSPWEFRAAKRLNDLMMPVTLAVWKKLSRREQVLYLSGIIDGGGYEVPDMSERRQLIDVIRTTLDGHAKNSGDQEKLVQPSVRVMLDGWRDGTRSFH